MIFLFLCIYHTFNIILCINILLPFKQLKLYSKEKEYNSTLFLDDNLNFISYSLINVGYPKQQLILLFNQNNNRILLHKNNLYCKYFSKNNNFNYIPDKSESLAILNESNYNTSNNAIFNFIISDTIELYTDKKCSRVIKSNLIFFYLKENNNISNNYCADFGFPINKYLNQINSMTFIQQIKDQKMIDKYLITIEFNSTYEGFYHIGSFPHEFDKNNFKEYQIISAYSIPKNFLFQFQLSIDKIFISYDNNNEYQLNENKIYFNLELGVIIGPTEYFQIIKKFFFEKYFQKNICKRVMIRKQIYDPLYSIIMPTNYYIISCEKIFIKDDLFFDVKLFPSINFYHRDMNYTFSFTYKELFEEINNVYYFLIIEVLNSEKEWKIGIPFFKKYQTTFNIDTRKIYFYNKNILVNNKIENNKKEKENNILLIIICLGLSIILIGIAFIFGKKFNENRKLRKNELEDNNYNYLGSLSKLEGKNGVNQIIEMNIRNKNI